MPPITYKIVSVSHDKVSWTDQRSLHHGDRFTPRPTLRSGVTVWRPRLITDPSYLYLFASRGGDPYNTASMSRLVEKMVWTFTQERPGGPICHVGSFRSHYPIHSMFQPWRQRH